MKKIIAAAAGLAMVGVMASSASAVEHQFGGYWRTRMFTQIDMDGTDRGTTSLVDTRTRLYYTAKFSDDFKFVNKFEFNNGWGDNNGGDFGADGTSIWRIKNSYADFNFANANFKVGTQALVISRGLLADTDASGIIATFNVGDIALPFAWFKVDEQYFGKNERDHYAFLPVIKAGEGLTIQPMFIYDKTEGEEWNNYYAGVNVDMKTDAFSFWGTGVYEFGEIMDQDVSAFLLAAGATAGPVHGQAFYATGDDDPTDGDWDQFVNTAGGSYYWAEILGLGTFDTADAGLAGTDQITDLWAANVGVKVKPADKLTLEADIWYASLAEDNAAGDSDLGFEFDVAATYAIMDNLALRLVAAYLVAGDAFGDEDPIEIGARLSLAF